MTEHGTGLPFALGYGTNGFADHPLEAALDVVGGEGYGAIALTLGHPHLDPFAPDLEDRLVWLRGRLAELGLRVVIETGTRYLLDPWHKHRPALVDEHAGSRVRFLERAVQIADALDAECVSFFSGVLPADATAEQGWQRLIERVGALVAVARARSVLLALEPEPGMLVETVADALRLRAALGNPPELRLTVDIGHCLVVEPEGLRGALLQAGGLLANVQLDDMRHTAHEHLPFGEGEVDLALALDTLVELDYRGVAAVELPRHSHDAPGLARRSMQALEDARSRFRPAGADPGPAVPAGPVKTWLAEARAAIAAEPSAVVRYFATAGRAAGRGPLRPVEDPAGVLFGTTDDAARRELVLSLADSAGSETRIGDLLGSLYRHGDTAERRGVLRGLDALASRPGGVDAGLAAAGLELIADALRSNDQSLVAAAAGPFAAAQLDQHSWRHAVLKLVFMGVSLDAVADLERRADGELARMAEDFAAERAAAGRPVPADLGRLTAVRQPAP